MATARRAPQTIVTPAAGRAGGQLDHAIGVSPAHLRNSSADSTRLAGCRDAGLREGCLPALRSNSSLHSITKPRIRRFAERPGPRSSGSIARCANSLSSCSPLLDPRLYAFRAALLPTPPPPRILSRASARPQCAARVPPSLVVVARAEYRLSRYLRAARHLLSPTPSAQYAQ
ncbi:hypothetical protein AAT19DRAFT_15457 [Rhodotorula toruloides]|uniref:Uncharacterized protein n=1 Tax=Rhodotorula toruloides TaxID=5286 RepID=A0A2T0A7B2_RHOTO|nr:hypothetical protein AAT19DRAFT_15457 [Rhodotorula toruloides]